MLCGSRVCTQYSMPSTAPPTLASMILRWPSHVQHEKHGIEFIGPPPAQAAYTDNHVAYCYTNAKRLGMYTTTGMLSQFQLIDCCLAQSPKTSVLGFQIGQII